MSMLIAVLVAAAAGTEAQPTTAQSKDPIVCKSAKLPDVGTRFKPPKVCKRKSEWNLEAQMTKRELQQINERGNNPGAAIAR